MTDSTTRTMAIRHDKEKLELVVERTFDAPRELVFDAWTTCEHLMKWWGTRTYPMSQCKLDLRPGGVWHYCLRGPNGEEAWGKATYDEIARPERLAFTDAFSNAQGDTVPPETKMTITFDDAGGKTRMLGRSKYRSLADLENVLEMGVEQGMSESLDMLEEFLRAQR
jgi:uncharacterized protein YndB with AHSA1/START domain